MAAFEYWVRSLVFSDGRQIDLSVDDVVLLVGGNNAGKSQVLKDIVLHLDHDASANPRGVVVKSASVSVSDDRKVLASSFSALDQVQQHEQHVGRMGALLSRRVIAGWEELKGTDLQNTLRRNLRAFVGSPSQDTAIGRLSR